MGKQIDALTASRGAAAIMVVIYHFGWSVFPFNRFPTFFHNGNLAVSYFFVLSGFVLYTAYEDRRIAYAGYIIRRVARIVPVYLLALLLLLCVSYAFYGFAFYSYTIKLIVVHALLLQAYLPDYAMNLNLPGWTLSVELFFYLLFPFLLLAIRKNAQLFITLTVLLYVCSQVVHLHYYPLRHTLSSNIIDTIIFNPVIHLSQFAIGMCGGFLFGKADLLNLRYKWLLAASFCVIVLLMNFMPKDISCQAGLLAPVFMVFILSLAICNPPFLNIKPLVFIGEISYGIYILQLPAFSLFSVLNDRYLHLHSRNYFYFVLSMLVIAATISYLLFEKPLRTKINTLYNRSTSVPEKG